MQFFRITEKLKFESTGVDSSRLAQVKLSQLKKTTQSTDLRLVSHFDMSILNYENMGNDVGWFVWCGDWEAFFLNSKKVVLGLINKNRGFSIELSQENPAKLA